MQMYDKFHQLMLTLHYLMFKMRDLMHFVHKITDFQHFPSLYSDFFIIKVHFFEKNT